MDGFATWHCPGPETRSEHRVDLSDSRFIHDFESVASSISRYASLHSHGLEQGAKLTRYS